MRKARLQRQRALGVELQKTFQNVADEQIPERLRELAEELDEKLSRGVPQPPDPKDR